MLPAACPKVDIHPRIKRITDALLALPHILLKPKADYKTSKKVHFNFLHVSIMICARKLKELQKKLSVNVGAARIKVVLQQTS